jgi:hypothetical protein
VVRVGGQRSQLLVARIAHRVPLNTAVPATVQQRALASPVWYTPAEQDRRAGPEPAEEVLTVARLAERGIQAMTDDEIREVTAGRTVRTVNLVTGQSATLHHSRDGKRTLIGLSDRPLVTPYEIRDGRRIETTVLGDRISVALFTVGGRILGRPRRRGRIGQLGSHPPVTQSPAQGEGPGMATTPGTNYDVVIVGSGFGGSISTSRLALAGLKVLVQRRFRRGRAIR